MAVVVNLDPLRQPVEFEEFGKFALDFRLGPAFGQAALERFHGVALGLFHQLATITALRNRKDDLAPGKFR